MAFPAAFIDELIARTDLVDTRVIDGVKYVLVRADGGVEVNGIDIKIEAEEE